MLRETEFVELKKSTAELKAGVVSIVAMLNKHGRGEVYFGVDDNGKVLGLTIGTTTFRDVTQAVVDNTCLKSFRMLKFRISMGKTAWWLRPRAPMGRIWRMDGRICVLASRTRR